MAVALLLIGQLLYAEDKKPSDSGGYQEVPIKSGDKTTYIKVQKQSDPFRHLSSSGSSDQYQPTQLISKTSSYANKQFAPKDSSLSKSSSFQQQTFLTKPAYLGNANKNSTTPNLNAKVAPENTTAYSHNSSEFNKSFATSSSDVSQNKKALFASNTSEYQGQTAPLGSSHVDTFASTALANKTYQGPETTYARHDMDQIAQGLSRMDGLPNRPLTIDEVRNLINHETKPNTNSKPEPESKPLNDPDYKPIASPAPSVDDEKDGLVPSPGSMATPQPPENSEALPK